MPRKDVTDQKIGHIILLYAPKTIYDMAFQSFNCERT